MQRFLRKLNKKGFFSSKQLYESVYPSGSQRSRLYGLPKLHKVKRQSEMPPFRPIISSVSSYNYNLAKFLCDLITPYISSEHCTEDSFTFVKEVQKVSNENICMVSYDVCSLFTNVPLHETIDIAVETTFQNKQNINIEKQELKQLFLYATSQTHFLFNR